jgi:hypothetical protein
MERKYGIGVIGLRMGLLMLEINKLAGKPVKAMQSF